MSLENIQYSGDKFDVNMGIVKYKRNREIRSVYNTLNILERVRKE